MWCQEGDYSSRSKLIFRWRKWQRQVLWVRFVTCLLQHPVSDNRVLKGYPKPTQFLQFKVATHNRKETSWSIGVKENDEETCMSTTKKTHQIHTLSLFFVTSWCHSVLSSTLLKSKWCLSYLPFLQDWLFTDCIRVIIFCHRAIKIISRVDRISKKRIISWVLMGIPGSDEKVGGKDVKKDTFHVKRRGGIRLRPEGKYYHFWVGDLFLVLYSCHEFKWNQNKNLQEEKKE